MFHFLRSRKKFQVTVIGIAVCTEQKPDPPFQTNESSKGRN